MIQGIIPAAGKALRWGGFYKEFLPISEGTTSLDYTIQAMLNAGVETFLVVTNSDKIQEHARHFDKRYKNIKVKFILQGKLELIGAINSALEYQEEINIFAMPDTIYEFDSLKRGLELLKSSHAPFVTGLFKTDLPDRFGCLIEDKFVDKPKNLPKGEYNAWGSFVFTKASSADTLDDFMNKNNTNIFYDIQFYMDLANFSEYKRFLCGGNV